MRYDAKGSAVLDMVGLEITGNVMPAEWFNHIKMDNGKPDTNAIILLADIVYWYRPVEVRSESTGKVIGYEKKFKADKLQRSYGAFAEQYGFSKDQVKFALARLVALGVIDLDWRTVHYGETLANNVLFIGLNVDNLRQITTPCANQMAQGVESNGTGGRIESHTNTKITTKTTTEEDSTALSGRDFSFATGSGSRSQKAVYADDEIERVEVGHENDDPRDNASPQNPLEHLIASLSNGYKFSKTSRRKLTDPVSVLQNGNQVLEPSPVEEMQAYPEEFSKWVKGQAVFLRNHGGCTVSKLCNMVTKYETATYGWLAVRPTNYDAHDPNAPWN